MKGTPRFVANSECRAAKQNMACNWAGLLYRLHERYKPHSISYWYEYVIEYSTEHAGSNDNSLDLNTGDARIESQPVYALF
jgi:hypothetical protein